MTFLLGQEAIAANELYDIVVLEPVPPIWPLVFWCIFGFFLFALIGVAVWYFLKGKKNKKSLSAVQTVKSKLRSIEQHRAELEPNQFSLAVSDALKDYLREKFDDPIRFETSQEFLNRSADAKSNVPVAVRQSLLQFLVESDEVKFSNLADPEPKLKPLLERADNIVNICERVSEDTTATPPPLSRPN